MSEIFRLRTQSEIDEEAATWVWRLDSNDLDDHERKRLHAWLSDDPRHRRALDEYSRVWSSLDGFALAGRDTDSVNLAGIEIRLIFRRRQLWWSLAASLVVCALAGALWLSQRVESQTFATAVGQRQEFTLADGSVVTLNTNSIVRTELHLHTRNIYLQKGEAHFQVAHDRSRPFLVYADGTMVRAVGTQFDVRLHADHKVDVVVNEGRVEVRPVPDTKTQEGSIAAAAPVRALNAGERLSTYSADVAVVPVTTQELSKAMAWRDGAIVFDGQSLAEAIAEVSRYTDTKIVLSNAEIAALPIGGRFKTDDLQGFFSALQAALPITVRNTADGQVYIDERL